MASQSTHKTLNISVERAGGPTGKGKSRRRWIWVLALASFAVGAGSIAFWFSHRENLTPDAYWTQAESDFMAGRYDRVDLALARLRRLREPTPLDWFLRAQLAMARNNYDEAIEDLARVPDEHYMASQARMLAGQTELRHDRVRRAEELFRAALKLDPRLVQAHRELIFIYGMQVRRSELSDEFMVLSKLSELTFDNVFHWGLLRNNSWEPGELITTLAKYVAADPGDRWSRLTLAETYRRMDRFDEAESVIAGLPAGDPHVIELRARIALDHQGQDEAERLLAQGPPDDPLLARLRGRLALSRREANAAVANFRIAYAADPEDRDTLFGLIAALELAGDKSAALPLREHVGRLDRLNSLIQRASVLDARTNAGLLRELGSACADLGRKYEARAWYKLAITLDPFDAESQQALFRLKEPDKDGNASSRPTATP
jgi:tetratricopeptide (TPR) repeat protein